MTLAYQFTITTRGLQDAATCGLWDAVSHGGCAARNLARLIVSEGGEDSPIEARGIDGRLRYTVRSLHAFARTKLVEEPSLRAWKPKDKVLALQDAA